MTNAAAYEPGPVPWFAPTRKLEIGGGTRPRDEFYNLDPLHGDFLGRAPDDLRFFADESCDHVYTSHTLEHIPSGDDRLVTFNEVHRILATGGRFEIIVPILMDQYGNPKWQAVADPTHVSFWVRQSFDYFCTKIANAEYPISWWEMESYQEIGYEARCVLRKPRNG